MAHLGLSIAFPATLAEPVSASFVRALSRHLGVPVAMRVVATAHDLAVLLVTRRADVVVASEDVAGALSAAGFGPCVGRLGGGSVLVSGRGGACAARVRSMLADMRGDVLPGACDEDQSSAAPVARTTTPPSQAGEWDRSGMVLGRLPAAGDRLATRR